MHVTVQGGTNAGWRKVAFHKRPDWRCPSCSAHNRYYWLRCPVCNHPRPDH